MNWICAFSRRLGTWGLGWTMLTSASLLQAAPAPWYWWVSKLNGERVCAQTMPTQGWERAEGPFARADCSQPVKQGLLRR